MSAYYTKGFVEDLKKELADNEVLKALPDDSLKDVLLDIWEELTFDIVADLVSAKKAQHRPVKTRKPRTVRTKDV